MFLFAEIAVIAVRPLLLLMGIRKRVASRIRFELRGSDLRYGGDCCGDAVVLTSHRLLPRVLHTSPVTGTVAMTGHAMKTLFEARFSA